MMANYTFLNLIPKFQNKKKISKPLQKQACVVTVMYTRHSTLYMYISCAAVHVCPSEKKASAEAFDRILLKPA